MTCEACYAPKNECRCLQRTRRSYYNPDSVDGTKKRNDRRRNSHLERLKIKRALRRGER